MSALPAGGLAPSALQSLQSLQECVLLCRPSNVVTFCARFFRDESRPNPAVCHAMHFIPFLLFEEVAFRTHMCTIFSYEISQQNPVRDGLDAATVLRILNEMACDDFVIIDEIRNVGRNVHFLNLSNSYGNYIRYSSQIIRECVETVHSFSFNAFLAAVRLPLCCSVVVLWSERLFEEFRYSTGNDIAMVAEIAQLQSHLAKQ